MAAPPGGGDDRQRRIDPVRSGEEGERTERGQHDPGGQTVETVDQVDRVDDQDDPADGQRQRQPAEVDDAPRHVEALKAEPEREREHGSATCQKSLTRAGMPRTSSMTPTTTRSAAPARIAGARFGRRTADRVQVVRRHRREGERHPEGDGDRHAAEPRHRELVDLALGVRLIEQSVPHARRGARAG